MKDKLFILLIILSVSFIQAKPEKWTIQDIYQKRQWKIISYEHHVQGYFVLMKQIRHSLVTRIDKKTLQAKIDFEFCSEYQYKISKEDTEYTLTHEFLSKFGKDGTIQFPTIFYSDMDTIDPHFENFMRKMLGKKIETLTSNAKPVKNVWKYKPIPPNSKNIWKISSLKKYASYYELIWKNKDSRMEQWTYIFTSSEKYFMLEKILNQINSDDLIEKYWNSASSPEIEFVNFMTSFLEIKDYDIQFSFTFNNIRQELILLGIDEKNIP